MKEQNTGEKKLQKVSERLTDKFGKGWSYPDLRKIRQFYLKYSKMIISDYQNSEQNDNQISMQFTYQLYLPEISELKSLVQAELDRLNNKTE